MSQSSISLTTSLFSKSSLSVWCPAVKPQCSITLEALFLFHLYDQEKSSKSVGSSTYAIKELNTQFTPTTEWWQLLLQQGPLYVVD